MRRWLILCVLLLSVLVACSPQSAQQQVTVEPLPTRVPSPTPMVMGDDNAQLIATNFLEAWRINDFEQMYGLISFASQQSTLQDNFVNLYQQVHEEMLLQDIDYQLNAMARDINNNRIVQIDYSMTFTTTILGEFTDPNRILQLVLDEEAGGWRVAWSRSNIFYEMGQGGILNMDISVPRRASIYDRNGIPLASQTGTIVTVNVVQQRIPNYPDTSACLNTLSQVLESPIEDIQDRFARSQLDWETEVGEIEPGIYEAWRSTLETDCDASFGNRFARYYDYGTLVPHIVGSVGFLDPDDVAAAEEAGFSQDAILGRTGIEGSWDEYLRGVPGGVLQILTPDGTVLRTIASSDAQPAQSVYLTIDIELQEFVLRRIEEAYNRYAEGWAQGSDGASAVVLDVNTGEILAMVSYPTYDANVFAPFSVLGSDVSQAMIQQITEDERNPLLNRATQGLYPAGSTFKVVTSTAVADSGVYELDQRYTCVGSWRREGDILRTDWLAGGHGTLTLAGAITNSCNPYFYEAGYQLNLEDPYLLPSYAARMGLGNFTGLLDIPESSGFIGNPDSVLARTGYPWAAPDAVSMSIGQGFVDVTPLQMARLYAGIANGGLLYRPQLVESVRLLDEISYQMESETNGFFEVDPAVINVVREGLCNVTIGNGTAAHIFRGSPLLNIGVCGKTGTATPHNNAPVPHAWFAGYAPRDEPQIVVLVMVENSGDGSATAAPIVADIMEYYFGYGADYNPF